MSTQKLLSVDAEADAKIFKGQTSYAELDFDAEALIFYVLLILYAKGSGKQVDLLSDGAPVEKKAKVNFSRPRGSSKFHFRTCIYSALQITSPKTRSAHSYKIVDSLLRPAVRSFTSRESTMFVLVSLLGILLRSSADSGNSWRLRFHLSVKGKVITLLGCVWDFFVATPM